MTASLFHETKAPVGNHGAPPDSFLAQLVAWGKSAPEEIFAARPSPSDRPDPDVYAHVRNELGPWTGIQHRRAVMLEVLRVLAAFESSWNWNEGVDTTNARSMANVKSEETGAFQVSYDSLPFGEDLRELVRSRLGEQVTPFSFVERMKDDHVLALEYAARLLRHTVAANGPVKRGEINPYLRRGAVFEFQSLLA